MFMFPRIRIVIALLALGFAAASPASLHAQTAPQPTQAQIVQMVDAKAYKPALRAIATALPLAGAEKAAGFDKYTLLMLRGECLLQLKDKPTAILAYEQAFAAAASIDQKEAARAMTLLLQKTPGFAFTPRTGDKTPLDLLNPDQRKAAIAALFADELPRVAAQAKEKLDAKSLPPILALGPTLRDLHALEQVGTGEDKQTAALVQPLADRIHGLIDAELGRLDPQLHAIERAANRVVDSGGGYFENVNGALRWVPSNGNTGLSSENRQTLRDSTAYLERIRSTCDDLAAVARRYERDGQRWQDLAKRTQGLLAFATAVYDHE